MMDSNKDSARGGSAFDSDSEGEVMMCGYLCVCGNVRCGTFVDLDPLD